MPNIIGIPAGKMIRTSVISDTDDLGLSRLTETYAFATSEFQTFRTRLINRTPYNTVMNYVYPAPTTTYPYVVIDSVSISEEVGGISTASVQYVGILKPTRASTGDTSWLPPAKQRIQPNLNTENQVSVIIDFIYYSDSDSPELDMIKRYGIGTSLPVSVNGLNLYRSIKAPYYYERNANVFAVDFSRPLSSATQPLSAPQQKSYTYYGMLCISQFSERIGLFIKVTNTYQDCALIVNEDTTSLIGVFPRER
jgi:hypothetical protein